MVRLLKHMKAKEWALVIVSIAFIVLQVQLDLKLPDYMSDITVLVQTKGSEMSDIFTAGGKMMGCALGSLASAIVVGFFAAKKAVGENLVIQTAFNKIWRLISWIIYGQLPPAVAL